MAINMGTFNKSLHTRCRRCGRRAYHRIKKICAACGYGKNKKLKKNFRRR